jgi:predicted Zn-dependent protease
MVEQTSFTSSALGSEQDRLAWDQAQKLVREGHDDQALALFRHDSKSTASSPGQPFFLVGAIHLYLGNQSEGIQYLRKALQLSPKLRGPHTYLGIVSLQQNKLDDAERELTTEIANDPNYQTAVAELGVVRYRQQRWAEAADQLSRSHTRNPALLLTLCDAYFYLGKVKDANVTAELAAAYAKNDPATLDSLSSLLMLNGQADLAARLNGSAQR